MENYQRQSTLAVQVGHVIIGGQAPIVVQSMTNTATEDICATTNQIMQLADAGSELVRITVNTPQAAQAVPEIASRLLQKNYHIPLIGDFHYNGHRLLHDYPEMAQTLAKYRINPGNVGRGNKHDSQFAMMIETAIANNKPIRIGVNWGSLDPDLVKQLMDENQQKPNPASGQEVMRQALIQSALGSAQLARKLGLSADKIILSCKVSSVPELITIYQQLAQACPYPLHVGLTEAGLGDKGLIATSGALAVLLHQGIGDTIRASLTPDPNGDRCREVQLCQTLLQSLQLRAFRPQVTACPGCGRTTSTVFQSLAQKIQIYIDKQMPIWRQQFPQVAHLKVAVMGCVVNGPGESKHADIGISLPGTGEAPAAPVFEDGKKVVTLRGNDIAEQFMTRLEQYILRKYQPSLQTDATN